MVKNKLKTLVNVLDSDDILEDMGKVIEKFEIIGYATGIYLYLKVNTKLF